MRCRICGTECNFLETVAGVFLGSNRLEANRHELENRNMDLYRCPNCTHIQTEYQLPDDFYKRYNAQSGAAQYSGALELTESKLRKLRSYASSSNWFIDIGCGTGHALGIVAHMFDHCLGVEPAYNTYYIAKEKGLNVLNNYFSRDLQLPIAGRAVSFLRISSVRASDGYLFCS